MTLVELCQLQLPSEIVENNKKRKIVKGKLPVCQQISLRNDDVLGHQLLKLEFGTGQYTSYVMIIIIPNMLKSDHFQSSTDLNC